MWSGVVASCACMVWCGMVRHGIVCDACHRSDATWEFLEAIFLELLGNGVRLSARLKPQALREQTLDLLVIAVHGRCPAPHQLRDPLKMHVFRRLHHFHCPDELVISLGESLLFRMRPGVPRAVHAYRHCRAPYQLRDPLKMLAFRRLHHLHLPGELVMPLGESLLFWMKPQPGVPRAVHADSYRRSRRGACEWRRMLYLYI